MTDYSALSDIFKALAHPVRLQILDILRGGEVCVCHIETALDKRQAYISQQLMKLRNLGLVDSRRDGLQMHYRLTDDRISAILEQVIGPPDEALQYRIEDCPCPRCEAEIERLPDR